MNSYLIPILCGAALCLVQFAAALPWLFLLDPRAFGNVARRPRTWLIAAVVIVGLGGLLSFFVSIVLQDPVRLAGWGRVFGALFHLQLVIDCFVFFFPLLMLVWPRGTAVAQAAFREAVRQPMFWLIGGLTLGLMVASPVFPYYTFGEDHKMVRELGYDMITLAAVLFGVLAASMSISEEIEGRTAITVMSKPVSRRQFLLGKFLGIFLATLLMILLLGWAFNSVMWATLVFLKETVPVPAWVEPVRLTWSDALTEPMFSFAAGMGIGLDSALSTMPGLIFGACQAMVLLSVAVALATRLPMVVNLVTCAAVFFVGHLTHVLVVVSAKRFALVSFTAKFFENVLPGLDYFDLGPVLVRDLPPDSRQFGFYIASVVAYAVLYSVIALLFGLILFEDRDLA